MVITTKFAVSDTMYYAHPLTQVLASSPVLDIKVEVDNLSFITITNHTSVGNLDYYINDDVAFATQEDLAAFYGPA